MKRTMMILAGLLLLGMGPNAAADEREMLAQVARDAEVSIDDVRMVLGSRTQHAQYRSSYDRKEARILAALARAQAQEKEAGTAQIVAANPTKSALRCNFRGRAAARTWR